MWLLKGATGRWGARCPTCVIGYPSIQGGWVERRRRLQLAGRHVEYAVLGYREAIGWISGAYILAN